MLTVQICEATQEVIPCYAEDAITGITVEASENVFAEGTTTNFVVITEDDGNYESVKNAVADKGSKFVAYNVQYMLNGTAVSANGEYTLLLPNTSAISEDNVSVLHVAEDGTVTEKDFTVNEDDKIAVKTTESGTYVVVDKSSVEESKDDAVEEKDEKVGEKTNSKMFVWIIAGGIILVIIGVTLSVVYTIKKKKVTESSEQ